MKIFLIITLTIVTGLIISSNASAVMFTGSQVNTTEWTYDLTYEPYDNYSIHQVQTTITLTGLFGVTSATGPSLTDFTTDHLNTLNLAWTSAVLDGGTTVQWTHTGPGTGNYGSYKHVYGFRVFASGAEDGTASLVTDGFSFDGTSPIDDDRDITGAISGPVGSAPGRVPDPVPEPATMLLFGIGLLGLAGVGRRNT